MTRTYSTALPAAFVVAAEAATAPAVAVLKYREFYLTVVVVVVVVVVDDSAGTVVVLLPTSTDFERGLLQQWHDLSLIHI